MFKAKNCYKLTIALLALWKSGRKKVLISEIIQEANEEISSVRYWLDKFDCFGFVEVIRYVKRKNSICVENRHVLVKINSRINILYSLVDHERWEKKIQNKKTTLKLLKVA